MQEEKEIQINVLTKELQDSEEKIANEKAKFEALVEETTKYEINQKIRDKELVELKNRMELIKNSITNFSEENYNLYLEYHEIENECKSNREAYKAIDERIKKRTEEMNDTKDSIISYKTHIRNVEEKLKKLESK